MKNFRFRLQSLTNLRERQRDQAAESLQLARQALRKLEEQISSLNGEIDQQIELQNQANQGAVQIQKLLESQRYQMQLSFQIQGLREKMDLIEQESRRRQSALIEREKAVRVLERLSDSQRLQWQNEQDKRQQHQLDEWAGYRHWEAGLIGHPDRVEE
jgi:flagellar protein FliJ